jgi:hypothetical protein
VAVLAAGVVWVKRTTLQVWYDVGGLVRAEEAERERWVGRVLRLDTAALPALMRALRRDSPRGCDNVHKVLARLMAQWGAEDPRAAGLAVTLAEAFPGLSPAGQRSVLELEAQWLASARGRQAPPVLMGAVKLLCQAHEHVGSAAYGAALDLAAELVMKVNSAEVVDACRALALKGLKDSDPDNRIRALRLGLQPAVALARQATSLLADPAPEVRRAAMILVGGTPAAVTPEELMGWLHDPDPEVRQLCEQALASQGVRPAHIRLARLKTDADPKKRLEVLDYLPYMTDLDPGVWVRSLSEDPVPAVRAAAVRAAVELSLVDLEDRIHQMAQSDPSPTLRQVCQYYLVCQRSNALSTGPH